MGTPPVTMTKGKRYRIVYQLPGYSTRRQAVGDYLGDTQFGDHQVSFRPLAGTTSLPAGCIELAVQTDQDVYLPRQFWG